MADHTSLENMAAAAANPVTVPSFTGTLAEGVQLVGGMGNALSVESRRRRAMTPSTASYRRSLP
jgi:hypothetical protein